MLSHSTLFNSPIKQAPRLALSFFILLAALFHLSTIYLFKIVYTPSHVSKPVPAQVFFLAPSSPSSEQLSCWLKSNDPSIFSPLKTIQAARLPIPSSIYDPKPAPLSLRPLPISQKDPAGDLLPPTDQAAMPSLLPRNTAPTPTGNITPTKKNTTIQLSDPLSIRISGSLGAPALPYEIPPSLPPTTLTLNINAEGIPRHVIVSKSCGNAVADEIASSWAMTLHFSKADDETWGTLLVLWGTNKEDGR